MKFTHTFHTDYYTIFCFVKSTEIQKFLRDVQHIFAYKKDTVSRVLELTVLSFLFQLKCTCIKLIVLTFFGNQVIV